MFEHAQLTGDKYRLLSAEQSYLCDSILEGREPSDGSSFDKTPRRQYSVVETLLVQRYLPSETVGDKWPHDSCGEPWWEVVDHPPHAGIVASFNKAVGGTYKRELVPQKNIVAFAGAGEPVVLNKCEYSTVRASDGAELTAPDLVSLRASYYAA